MALNPADIATVSRLLDELLELPPAEREPWLVALPPVHQRHADALREMLAQEARLDTDQPLQAMPKLAADEAVAHAGDHVGPYRLLREIGRGGMGSVWLAERSDGAFKRQVALKLPRLAWGAGLAERMARERDIGALLEHPAIARLYDAGVDERGRPYLALEYIDGQPIDAWCEAQGLNVRDRLRLFVQVARAVAYAHGRLVVHRDLKPSNVMVTPDGQTHLLDFGIAKLLTEAAMQETTGLTQQQGRVLTPHYASPEQVAGEAITVQSDVYSLGVLLYELLTHTLPIAPKRSTLGAVEEAILEGDAPPASSRVKDKATARALRGEVDAILAKAMQREPGRRYATADAMAQDIERHLNGETVSARPDSLAYRLRKGLRRNWLPASAAAAVLTAVLTGGGVAVVQAQRAAKSAERERVVKAFVSDVFRVGSRSDPRNTALRPASPQALIEGGAQLIQQRFAGQPELQAELFGVVGGIFADMGAHQLAANYVSRQVESLVLVKADRIEQARALLRLAQALVDDGQFVDAEPRISRVLELNGTEGPLGADARVLLAQVLLERGRAADSLALLDEVETWLKSQGSSPTATQAKALALRGRHLRRLNRAEEAFAILDRAIDVAIAAEGRLSTTAIAVRLNVAHFLAASTRDDLAKPAFKAAESALRELGGAHEARAIMEAARFAWRRKAAFSHGTLAEAEATIDASRRALAALHLPTPEVFAHRLDFLQGSLQADYGYITSGLPLLEASAPALLAGTQSADDVRQVYGKLGQALMHAGRHDEADIWLRKRLEAVNADGLRSHPYNAWNYQRVAQNLRMKGDHAAANAVLESAPSFEAVSGEGLTNPLRYTRIIPLERAESLLDQGKYEAALILLRRHTLRDGEHALDIRWFEEVMGRARCDTGSWTLGLAGLRKSLAIVEGFDVSPNDPWFALTRARVGLCALAAGDRRLALESARLARAVFVAQPQVSPYYKAPLKKLERELGLQLPAV